MKPGHYDTFALKHGDHVRTFSDVEVTQFKPYKDSDEERWELSGIEHVDRSTPSEPNLIVDEPRTVGFLLEHVISDAE